MSSTHTATFVAFDIRFIFELPSARDAGFVREFHAAYRPLPKDFVRSISVSASDGDPSALARRGRDVPTHRSRSYSRWNQRALVRRFRSVVEARWPMYGVGARLDLDAGSIEAVFARGQPPLLQAELVLTICRNLSLYLRDPDRGEVVHASAVAIGGQGIAFVGQQGAGKTTLLLEACKRGGVRPLADDRVRVTPSAVPLLESWPAYVTYCEGTMLNYPQLVRASADAASGRYPYATEVFGEHLRPEFTSEFKRYYPMRWFVRAFEKHYLPSAPLAAITLPQLVPGARLDVRRLDLSSRRDSAVLAGVLATECLDDLDPDFPPWHGLTSSGSPTALAQLFEEHDFPIFSVRLDPRDTSAVSALWRELDRLTTAGQAVGVNKPSALR